MKINKLYTNINHSPLKRTKDDIKWIVIHYVGALGDSRNNAEHYATSYVGASADFYVGHTGEIWQGNNYYTHYSWHCGGGYQSYWTKDGGGQYYKKCTNPNSIGIEMCVHKKSKATMDATDTDWYFEEATVNATIELVAKLMKELDIDINHVIRHYDVNRKICPNPYVIDYEKWKSFKKRIAEYNGELIPDKGRSTSWYRVRISWDNPKSQLGAYSSLNNAKLACPEGYKVFDEKGNVVYSKDVEKIGTQSSDFTQSMSEKECAEKILVMARNEGIRSGILPSLISAQAILESGYCRTTELVKKANNCFGMKCSLSNNTWESVWDGKSKATIRTAEEYTRGIITYINADFRAYPNIEKSFEDHSCYLLGAMNGSEKRYKGLTDCKNYKEAITLVKNGGYATDSSYITKLCAIVERFDLDRYDAEVVSKITPVKIDEDTKSVFYRVGESWNDGKCIGQVGAFLVLDNAKKVADQTNLNVFAPDGKQIYPVKKEVNKVDNSVHPFVKVGLEFNDTMKSDIQKGIKWFYSNHGCKATFQSARKNEIYKTNCAKFINWILRELDITTSGTTMYGSYGKIKWNSLTKKLIEEKCDIIHVNGAKTVSQMVRKGELLAGDIVMFQNLQHTNMYAGNGCWFDAGHANCVGEGEGAIFKTWYAKGTPYDNQKVSYVIRYKGIRYRVQCGAYSNLKNAENMVSQMKQEGFDAEVVTIKNVHIAQAGIFISKKRAESLKEKIAATGLPCSVEEIN